jgi:hypothetical protein
MIIAAGDTNPRPEPELPNLAERRKKDAILLQAHDLGEQGIGSSVRRARALAMVVQLNLDLADIAQPDQAIEPARDQQGTTAPSQTSLDTIPGKRLKPLQ